jgi:dolichol-phosphate mannosyltransferase
MSVECVKRNVETAVVPITYEPRPDESETNLRPFRDGAVILSTLYKMAKTNNPLFYFGSVGALSSLVGVALAGYVAYEWFIRDISHEVIAVVAGVAVLFGVQLLMFGVLSDMMVAITREQTREIRRLTTELADEDDPHQARADHGGGDPTKSAEAGDSSSGQN